MWGDKLSVAVDFYTYSRSGFTSYQSISPTFALLGADPAGGLVAGATSQLNNFFSTNPEGIGAIQTLTVLQVMPAFALDPTNPADQLTAFGKVTPGSPIFDAIFAGAVGANISAVQAGTIQTITAGFAAAGLHLTIMHLLYILFLVFRRVLVLLTMVLCTQRQVIEDILAQDLILVVM